MKPFSSVIMYRHGKFSILSAAFIYGTAIAAIGSNGPVGPEPILNDHKEIHYGSSISPDGKTMYFTHAAPDFSDRHIMQARLENGYVVDKSQVQFEGKPMVGGDTQISPDGQTLVFYSRENIGRHEERTDGDLLYATKTSNGWSEPIRFGKSINTLQNEFYPVLTNSGNLYFARENKDTSYDLYVAEYQRGKYQTARKLNNLINTDLLESDAYIAPDESFMVFVRMFEKGSFGVSDLYISYHDGNDWSAPENLGARVNFSGVDGSPFVTQDKKWLYFTSNRDAPDPTQFNGYLGVFRLPFSQFLKAQNLRPDQRQSDKVYQEVSTLTPYFQQGKVIFNTSMPDDASAHYFTDNSGFEWGPTAIYERTANGSAKALQLKGASIPADVHISPDGNTLYFADYGVNPGRIFQAKQHNNQWQSPEVFEAIPAGSGYLTSTRTNEFVFTKDRDIWMLKENKLEKLPDSINTDKGEHDPFIAQDGSFLIFVREDSEGDSNMYLSVRSEAGWTKAEKLPAPFNADKVDGSPYVTPDKQYLFFSSNRGGDVLRTWQAPIGSWIASRLNADG